MHMSRSGASHCIQHCIDPIRHVYGAMNVSLELFGRSNVDSNLGDITVRRHVLTQSDEEPRKKAFVIELQTDKRLKRALNSEQDTFYRDYSE